MRRYDVASLAAAVNLPEHELCRRLGWSGSQARRRRAEGMSERVADHAAVKLGLTPWLVWEHWLDGAKASCVECGGEFVPTRKGNVYCGRPCLLRRAQRKYQAKRQQDAEWRARRSAERKRYYAECRAYLNAQDRARYAAKKSTGFSSRSAHPTRDEVAA